MKMKDMQKSVAIRILATLAFAGTLAVNALANLLPINGLNTGEVSDLYPSLFTPVGITFSIWSVIYILLTGFVIYFWVHRRDAFIDTLLPWFIMSCILNMGWILVWHFLLPVASVCIMLVMLVVLVSMFRRVHTPRRAYTEWEQVVVLLPFTLYAAWICVATIANISALLVWAGWQGGILTYEQWTALMMGVAALVAILVTANYRTPVFALVVIWALFGIYLRWRETEYTVIIRTAIALQVALAVTILLVLRRRVTA